MRALGFNRSNADGRARTERPEIHAKPNIKIELCLVSMIYGYVCVYTYGSKSKPQNRKRDPPTRKTFDDEATIRQKAIAFQLAPISPRRLLETSLTDNGTPKQS